MRQAITPNMKVLCLLHRAVVTCAICGNEILPGDMIQWDHVWPLCAGGPHSFDNLRPLHEECHKEKTARDVGLNAKVKRLMRGKRKSKRPMKSGSRRIPSRGFERKKRRGWG